MKKKIMLIITVVVWILVAICAYIYLNTSKVQVENNASKSIEVKPTKGNKAKQILSRALVDDGSLGFMKSTQYVKNIIRKYFTDWSIKEISSFFSKREKSKKNIEIISKALPGYIEKYGKYQSSKIIEYKLLDKIKASMVTVDVLFEKDKAIVDFVLIESDDKSTLQVYLFRIREEKKEVKKEDKKE